MSIVSVGPAVAVAGEKVSGVVVVLGRSSPSMRTVTSAVRAPPAPAVMREMPKVAALIVVGSRPPASTSPVPKPAGQAAAKSVAAAQPLAVAAVPATYAPSGSDAGSATANAFDDVEPSTAETFASHVDLSVATAGRTCR